MSDKYLLGIDLGTSGTKTVLFHQNGTAIASSTVEYPLSQPENGWAEQAPGDWWDAAVQTISAVLRKSAVNPEAIAALGISGQMHGLVMLDEAGEVLRPSIIWADQRTGKECEEITEIIGAKRVIEITANPVLTGFTAGKIRWVQKHQPEIYAKCRHILLPKDFLRYKLTGDFATEVSDASGMQLLDVPNRCWSDEMLSKLGIDKSYLGKVYESPEVTGHINAAASKLTGLSEATLVVGGAGDNAAAAVGTGVVADGRAFTTIGTSGVVFAHTDNLAVDPQGRVHTFCSAVPGAWHVMGVVQSAGLSLKWFRDNFCTSEIETASLMGIDPYQLMDMEVQKAPIGANRLFYLPYLMGERTPHKDPDCRGVFFGLSAMHTKLDLMRAVYEGVAYALNDSLSVLDEMGVKPAQMLATGGGGRSEVWRQMLADVFDCKVVTTNSKEGPALGVAILAGVGAGLYASVREACDSMIKVGGEQLPVKENQPAYRKGYAQYVKLYPDMKNAFKRLTE